MFTTILMSRLQALNSDAVGLEAENVSQFQRLIKHRNIKGLFLAGEAVSNSPTFSPVRNSPTYLTTQQIRWCKSPLETRTAEHFLLKIR